MFLKVLGVERKRQRCESPNGRSKTLSAGEGFQGGPGFGLMRALRGRRKKGSVAQG
jgi:hypothetical protein